MARWRRQLYRGACWVKRLSNGSTKLVPVLAVTEQQRPETFVVRRMRSVEPSHGVSAADDVYAAAAGNVPRACADHSRCVLATSSLVGVTENQVISTRCDVHCEPVHISWLFYGKFKDKHGSPLLSLPSPPFPLFAPFPIP